MERIEHRACFGGWQDVYEHRSDALNCTMRFAIYLPPQAESRACPVLYWLSGLTCTEQNFITKAGAQRYAAEHGVIVVAPDTSPRGDDVADAEAYDLGKGAGFYLNATQTPWSAHYRMHDYIVHELPASDRSALPRERCARDQRTFDGRARRLVPRAAQSRSLSQRVGVFADRRAERGAVGTESVRGVFGRGSRDVGGMG